VINNQAGIKGGGICSGVTLQLTDVVFAHNTPNNVDSY